MYITKGECYLVCVHSGECVAALLSLEACAPPFNWECEDCDPEPRNVRQLRSNQNQDSCWRTDLS